MTEAKAKRFIYTKIIALILLPSFLWVSLLLIVPYSATYDLLLKLILWGIPAYVFPKLVENNNPNKFLLLNRFPSGKWILLSVAFLIVYIALINGGRLEAKPVSLFYVVSAVVMSPIIEEIAFRGVVLPLFHQFMGWAYANVATALLFMLYHIPLWLVRGQGVSLMGCSWVIFFAVCMGYVMSQSKSLWNCIIIHAVQNLLFGIL
jgi:membrane protease YdiL (CAAX protease family)